MPASSTATAKSTRRIERSRRGACSPPSQPLNAVFNYQSLFGTSLINELKVGYNRPRYDALAFGPSGYDPTQVSLSGTVTSSSLDARGTTGVARSGLLVRATSNASTNGQAYDPHSLSLSDTVTLNRGNHTFKFGGEYPEHRIEIPVSREQRDHVRRDQRVHRQPAAAGRRRPRFAFLHAPAVLRSGIRAGLLARDRPTYPGARPPVRLLLRREGKRRAGATLLHRGERLLDGP